MANIPQKSKDPTEDALTAIQDALNLRPPERRAVTPTAPASDSDPAQGAPTADLFHDEQQVSGWASDETRPRAANDDRASVGQLLQAMHRRPARLPYIIAGVAALAWTAGGLALAYLYEGELQDLLATPRVGFAAMVGIACAIAVPLLFFFVLAHM